MKDLVSDGFAQVVKPYIDAQDKTTREILAPVETDETDASRAYQIGDQLILGGILYDVIAPISQHGIITSTGSGANIEEADNITDQIDAVNDALTNVQNVLGAKNLLPNNASSRVVNGVTFTVNNDGSVTAQGTATATAILNLDNTFVGEVGKQYVMSGCPSGGFDIDNEYYAISSYTSNVIDNRDHGDSIVIEGNGQAQITRILIYPSAGEVNLTFKPMIRPVGTDPTYVPYAKTNRELTNDLDILEGLTYNSTLGAINGYYTKAGHVVIVSFRITLNVAINNTVVDIGRITKILPTSIPIYNSKQITWTARNSSRGGYIHGYAVLNLDSSISNNGRIVAESGNAQIGDVLYITFSYIAE